MEDIRKQRFCRSPGVVARSLDDEIFLVDTGNDSLFHLNQTGSAIWTLLENPASGEEVIDILCAAFPDVSSDSIEQDALKLMRSLIRRGLLIPQP